MLFVVYKVTYIGSVLDSKYYIGSTSLEIANSGKYFGSISSKKWKNIYKQETIKNPQDFKLEILSSHPTRKDALLEELRLHIELDVVNDDNYFNKSLASPNGWFGRKISGPEHHSYGRKRSEESKQKMRESKLGTHASLETRAKMSEIRKGIIQKSEHIEKRVNKLIGKSRTEESKKKMSESQKGNTNKKGKLLSDESKDKIRNANIGKKMSMNTKNKISEANVGKKRIIVECPYCKKPGGYPSMIRWHFENCKENI
jgi:hypothetical protein